MHSILPEIGIAVLAATIDSTEQAEDLKTSGANEVLLPYSLIGETIAEILLDWQRKGA
jgi:voltage-gated potassium channel Kch